MTRKMPAGAKIVINARVDADDVRKLDELSAIEGSVNYQRSRSELIGFAVREYVEKHYARSRRQTDRDK